MIALTLLTRLLMAVSTDVLSAPSVLEVDGAMVSDPTALSSKMFFNCIKGICKKNGDHRVI